MTPGSSNQHWIETYKSLFALSIEGFKFAALANGGAAVAVLAYLGNVAGKGTSPPDMRWAMAFFLAGLASCGFSMLLAYLTQLTLLGESTSAVSRPLKYQSTPPAASASMARLIDVG